MTLREIVEYADNMKPNAFDPQDKVRWLNELELSIQVDVMGREDDPVIHAWSENWSGAGITFPDSKTIVIPSEIRANQGGLLSVEGLELYPENEIRAVPVTAAARSGGATTITVAEGTFTPGGVPETGAASVTYDGQSEEMVAPVIWHKIYYTYLEARIDAANSEWGMYANSITLCNQFAGEFQRWYARKYIDPED